MAKPKQRRIRNSGLIPERRHDAFLLALLLALFLNISFFAIQALIPRLSHLLQMLGGTPVEQVDPDADAFPFVLVPADFLDEEILSQTPPQALSTVDREARQSDPSEELPFDRAYVEDGLEEIHTPAPGQTGPEESSVAQPEAAPSEESPESDATPSEEEPTEQDQPDDNPMPEGDPDGDGEDDAYADVPQETPPEPEPPVEEPEPMPEPPEPVEEPEFIPPSDPIPAFVPDPIEEPPEPDPDTWLPPPPVDQLPQPEAVSEPEPPEEFEPEPQPEPLPDIEPEVIDLAALPQSQDGFLDQQRQYLEELARREEMERRRRVQEEMERQERERVLEQQRQYEEYQRQLEEQRQLEAMRRRQEMERQQEIERQHLEMQRRQEEMLRRQEIERQQEIQRQEMERREYERRVEQERQRQEIQERQRQQEAAERQRQQEAAERQRQQQEYERQQQQQQEAERQQRPREGRRQPTFRKIGPNAEASNPSRESRRSTPGGAPRQRNVQSRVNLLDSDPNMKVLAHRYGEYMKKLAEQLQQSLNREVILNPTYYTRGQAKIFFTITADGSLGYYDTQYPEAGELDYVRITSERTLVNAAPFDRPTRQMLEDPLFQRMSLTVNLY